MSVPSTIASILQYQTRPVLQQHNLQRTASRLHSETGTCSQSSGQQVQHAPFANIECKLTSAGVGGGEMLGLVDGSLVSVTGAFDCTPRTPPAGHPWGGKSGKV